MEADPGRPVVGPFGHRKPAPNGDTGSGLPVRWALSVLDFRAHALADRGDDPIGVVIARCGHHLRAAVPTSHTPCGAPCPSCRETLTQPAPQSPPGGAR